MPKLIIDDKEIEVENGLTVMQACEQAGIEIPHFCFHEKLKIAGNCRMCLVEMEKSPKPIASCAMPATEGMVIRTSTETVKKAREGVMEFLLINHPLDCPICDQGGECDLQDQAFKYGRGKSRYEENKRAVANKNLGPLIKTHMTRCIHCTRCIRFLTDIAGVPEMGTIHRGEDMEITGYLEKSLTSELSGNIIDLCPVGALTSKPYAFKARSWELEKTESIDVMDAVGSNIRIDSRGMEVMRVLPKLNEDINEDWISDKARFSYDGLKNQRLDVPYVRKNGNLVQASWKEAINTVVGKLAAATGSEVAAIAGTTVSSEALFLLKKLFSLLGSDKLDANQFGYKIDTTSRSNYLFNTTIADIDKADFCLLIGANPRQVTPVLNARIGKGVRERGMVVARVGQSDNQTYPVMELGDNLAILSDILNGKSAIETHLKNSKNPMVIIGDSVLIRDDAFAIISLVHNIIAKYEFIQSGWNGFNILHNHASTVGALDLGFYYGKDGRGCANILDMTDAGKVNFLYLMAADDIDMSKIGKECFVVYQGHHGDKGASRADVILPEAAYTEQDGIFVNMEGRPQYARAAVSPVGQARYSVEIIADIASGLGYKTAKKIGEIRKIMAQENAVFAYIDEIIPTDFIALELKEKINEVPLQKIDFNYYMTDSISRASVTMARCSKQILGRIIDNGEG